MHAHAVTTTAHCSCCVLRPAQVRAAAALSNVRQVTEEELEAIVGGSIDTPTVVDFYATWCGPCLLLATELEKVGVVWVGGLVVPGSWGWCWCWCWYCNWTRALDTRHTRQSPWRA
jgi:hypothetical protein